MIRSHHCGELTLPQVGQTVTLAGWVASLRDHGGVIFIDIRDRYGLTQIVFNSEENAPLHAIADRLRNEYVISITGTVAARPDESENLHLPTGSIEIRAQTLELLNEATPLPFTIEDDVHTSE